MALSFRCDGVPQEETWNNVLDAKRAEQEDGSACAAQVSTCDGSTSATDRRVDQAIDGHDCRHCSSVEAMLCQATMVE